eukprot:CAMPEP_0183421052 /NCGR_PEP_ID=MMETSP0370-20130417/26845_1 /TAXON_ID=268820 /ORGANISM="Peridinium aciculiferum, Strain PAER-2" /LENGTH=40 /DNA_ID= /DNA_START= /DNA_END= /DNA_ORIENTATION=
MSLANGQWALEECAHSVSTAGIWQSEFWIVNLGMIANASQ